MTNDSKIKMMRDGSIKTALLKLGLPTMIGMSVSALYSVVDAFFAGWLGIQQVGAISVVFPIVQIIIGLAMMFGSGAASFISRLIGKEDRKRANEVASTSLAISLIVGLSSIIMVLIFLNPLLIYLGATETVLPYARDYALIYVSGAVLTIFNITMNNMVAGEGRTKLTMISMIVGGSLNIILDPIFIFVLNKGIKGAAFATVCAQAITSLIYIYYILRKKGYLRFSIRFVKFDKIIFSEILKVGIPILLYQLLTSLSIGMTNSAASSYGDSALAAFAVVIRISTMATYVVFGFMKGFQPFVGYNYGAKQYFRVNKAINIVLKWSSVFCMIYCLIVFIFCESIISNFTKTNDLEMIRIGVNALRANSIGLLFFGFQQVYMSLFLALGKAKEGALLSLSRQGYFFILLILLLPNLFNLNGIILTQPIADLLTFLLTLNFAYKFHKEFNKKITFYDIKAEEYKKNNISVS